MKKIALISAATAATFAFTATAASGAVVDQRLTVKLTSTKAGTKSKPAAVGITVSTGTNTQNADGTKNTITYAKIFLPKGIKLNYKNFPACADPTTCADSAPDSKIGSGTAEASVQGVDFPPKGVLTPFIGTSGRLVIRTEFTQPAVIDLPLIGNISTAAGGYAFDFNVPEKLQTPLPNADQQINDFTLKFDKKTAKKGKKKIGLVELTGCTGGKYTFKGEFKFKNGDTAATSTTVKCKAAKK